MSLLLAVRGRAVVTRKGAARLAEGHLWVYAGDVAARPECEAGVVAITDERGRHVGLALYSPGSQITLRYLDDGKELPSDFVRTRLSQALERRRRIYAQADAYRWVHGEADLLPSVFVD